MKIWHFWNKSNSDFNCKTFKIYDISMMVNKMFFRKKIGIIEKYLPTLARTAHCLLFTVAHIFVISFFCNKDCRWDNVIGENAHCLIGPLMKERKCPLKLEKICRIPEKAVSGNIFYRQADRCSQACSLWAASSLVKNNKQAVAGYSQNA